MQCILSIFQIYLFISSLQGVDEFMRRVGEHFEVLIYTASLSKYADPLLDRLDIHKVMIQYNVNILY